MAKFSKPFLILISIFIFGYGLSALDCSKGSEDRKNSTCEPVVMVIRHAEDTSEGPKALTDSGKNHANLYVSLFKTYVYGKPHRVSAGGKDNCVCPIQKIITVDPKTTSNPYNTIAPLAKSLGLSIMIKDEATGQIYNSGFNWKTPSRLTLLETKGGSPYSTVIAWTRQGLNHRPSDIAPAQKWGENLDHLPLLKQLAKVFTPEPSKNQSENGFTPNRNHFFVFSLQDKNDGKFNFFKLYTQQYSNDGNSWYLNPFLKDFPKYIGVK